MPFIKYLKNDREVPECLKPCFTTIEMMIEANVELFKRNNSSSVEFVFLTIWLNYKLSIIQL